MATAHPPPTAGSDPQHAAAPAAHVPAAGAHTPAPAAVATTGLARQPPEGETTLQAVARLRQAIASEHGEVPLVCVLGGTKLNAEDSEGLIKAVAAELWNRLGKEACFITGGMDGVQKVFAQACKPEARLLNLLPAAQASGYGCGLDVFAGKDLEERKQVFGLLGDVYVTVEGGPGVSGEARAASARGAGVVPLLRSGGASGGMFEFPAKALQKPAGFPQDQWALLGNTEAPVQASGAAAAALLEALLKERRPLRPPAGLPEEAEEAVARLREALGEAPIICILGGTKFSDPDSEALVKALAQELSTKLADGKATLVTGGMDGVQKAFAQSCGEKATLYNLLPLHQASGFGHGIDAYAGKDLEARKEVFGLLGDAYVTVEGGPGVAQEARAAAARGAAVVPLLRTGGASGGMFDFPAEALQKPRFATEEQWNLLGRKDVPPAQSAAAAAAILVGFVTAHPPFGAPPPEGVAGAMEQSGPKEMAAAFAMLDEKKTGQLNREQGRKWLRALGWVLADSDLDSLLSGLDPNQPPVVTGGSCWRRPSKDAAMHQKDSYTFKELTDIAAKNLSRHNGSVEELQNELKWLARGTTNLKKQCLRDTLDAAAGTS